MPKDSIVNFVTSKFTFLSIGILSGITYTRRFLRSHGLYKMGPNVEITFVNFQQVPESAYFAIHHRQTLKAYEVAVQFILEPFYKRHIVITALGVFTQKNKRPISILNSIKRSVALAFLTHVYDDSNIDTLSSDEKFWHIAQVMNTNTAVSVFPDREGCQFYGDDIFYFREGLFAASLFNQVPIMDHIIVEPTSSNDITTIDILQYDPPLQEETKIRSLEAYTCWRGLNADLITEYTNDCEKRFRERLFMREQEKISNSLTLGLCDPKSSEYENIDKRILRNRFYLRGEKSQK